MSDCYLHLELPVSIVPSVAGTAFFLSGGWNGNSAVVTSAPYFNMYASLYLLNVQPLFVL